MVACAGTLSALSLLQIPAALSRDEESPLPKTLTDLYGWLAPFRSLNTYGLFATMTTDRLEISVDNSSLDDRYCTLSSTLDSSSPRSAALWLPDSCGMSESTLPMPTMRTTPGFA